MARQFQPPLRVLLAVVEHVAAMLEETLSRMDPLNPDYAGTDTALRAILDQLHSSLGDLRKLASSSSQPSNET